MAGRRQSEGGRRQSEGGLGSNMLMAVEACGGLHARLSDEDGIVTAKGALMAVLAVEREVEESHLQALIVSPRTGEGGLTFAGLCEVMSYAMKGERVVLDELRVRDERGEAVTATLEEANEALPPAILHPAFGQPQMWLDTSQAYAPYCTAKGPVTSFTFTHTEETFTIRARDWLDQPTSSGGAAFECWLRGPKRETVQVTDNGDGTYTGSYTILLSGNYALHITLDRLHIKGSPFSVAVDTDLTTPSYCIAKGEGLQNAIAGVQAGFIIYKRDRLGNPRTRGFDTFYANISGPGKWDMKMKDNKDGSYEVVYTVRVSARPRPLHSCAR